jgi:hypothetical protein
MNVPCAVSCAETIAALYRGDLQCTISEPATDTQVRIEEVSRGAFQVTFPGTASLTDWRTDAKVRRAEWACGGLVHRGFAGAFWSVKTEIFRALQDARRVIVTGHSLGGALATLCADAMISQGWGDKIRNVITFGSPRVGNGKFAQLYNVTLGARTRRVVNAGDPVPHVPWLFGRYRHVDTQVYLTPDSEVVIDQPLLTYARELPQQLTARTASEFAVLTGHHGIESYLEKLKAS